MAFKLHHIIINHKVRSNETYIFVEELSILPSIREIDFGIELELGT